MSIRNVENIQPLQLQKRKRRPLSDAESPHELSSLSREIKDASVTACDRKYNPLIMLQYVLGAQLVATPLPSPLMGTASRADGPLPFTRNSTGQRAIINP